MSGAGPWKTPHSVPWTLGSLPPDAMRPLSLNFLKEPHLSDRPVPICTPGMDWSTSLSRVLGPCTNQLRRQTSFHVPRSPVMAGKLLSLGTLALSAVGTSQPREGGPARAGFGVGGLGSNHGPTLTVGPPAAPHMSERHCCICEQGWACPLCPFQVALMTVS